MANNVIIPARPTRYNGTLFRSRLEAKWAVFFESIGCGVKYEDHTVGTPLGAYTPDFTIDHTFDVEVKPVMPNRDYLELLRCASVATHLPLVLLCGAPSVLGEVKDSPSLGYYFDGDGSQDGMYWLVPCKCEGVCVFTESKIEVLNCSCEGRWSPFRPSRVWSEAILKARHFRFDL